MAERFSESAFVPTPDGVRLATDIYLPQPHAGRVPAVVLRTPYDMRWEATLFGRLGELFANEGFAFVAQDARGRFRSDGEPEPFVHEASDGHATFDWIVGQPWSNGRAALIGDSYAGIAALLAAGTHHPALRALAIVNTSTDPMREWLHRQGILRLQFAVSWALAAWSGPGLCLADIPWHHRPLEGLIGAAAAGRQSPALERWARGGATARAWERDPGWPGLIDRVAVPAFFRTGWWDLFARGTLRDWARLRSKTGIVHPLVVEPTDHDYNRWEDDPTPNPLDDTDFAAELLARRHAAEFRFLRAALAGERLPARRGGSVEWTLTHGGGRRSDTWPPQGAAVLRLHLADGGRARTGPEGGSLWTRRDALGGAVRWDHDPAAPVPSLEGDIAAHRLRRPDEREVQVRDDVLTFTGAPLRADLDLAGPAALTVAVSTSAPAGHLMAKLTDVYPEGPARRIVDGAAAFGGGPDAAMVRVDLGHTGYRVRAGHRLRLEVAASAFPRYIWAVGTDADPWTALHGVGCEMRILLGEGSGFIDLTTAGVADTLAGME